MRDTLIHEAEDLFERGQNLAHKGDKQGASAAYKQALQALLALAPGKERDKHLAHVYLSRFKVQANNRKGNLHDLRLGYSYAKTSQEPMIRALAEEMWQHYLSS